MVSDERLNARRQASRNIGAPAVGSVARPQPSRPLERLRKVYSFALLLSVLLPVEIARLGNSSSSSLLLMDVLSAGCILVFGCEKSRLRSFALTIAALVLSSVLGVILAYFAYPTVSNIVTFAFVKLLALAGLAISAVRIEFRSRSTQLIFLSAAAVMLWSVVSGTDLSFSSFVFGRSAGAFMYVGGRQVNVQEMIQASRELFFLASTKYLWALFFIACGLIYLGRAINGRVASACGFVCVLILVYVSDSKSDFYGSAIALLVCWVLRPQQFMSTRAGAFILASLLIVSSLLASIAFVASGMSLVFPNSTFGARAFDWLYFWEHIVNLPFVFVSGYGPNGFRIVQQSIGSFLGFGHNAGLTLLVEHGIWVGWLACYAFFRSTEIVRGRSDGVRWLFCFFILQRALVMITADAWFGFDIMVPVTTLTIIVLAKSDLWNDHSGRFRRANGEAEGKASRDR